MPMPPPRASTELKGGRRRRAEVDQIVRALRAEGPADNDELARRVAAQYWDKKRYDQSLTWALSQGLINRDADGRLTAV
jgi:uncharacterized protein YcaQ